MLIPTSRFVSLLLVLLIYTAGVRTSEARTIAVVYDNSGSMDGCPRDEKGKVTSSVCDNRYAYASYSLQTLRALMGPTDILAVVFTSSPTTVWRNGVNAPGDINHLRDVTSKPKGNTPHAAVERALDVLASNKDSDRWLVMITDGQFQAKVDVPGMVDSFLSVNGRGLKVLLLGLSDDATGNSILEIWKEKAGAKAYFAKASKEIRDQMQQIAAIVTSNTDRGIQVEAKGTTITFTPRFALKRFTLLQQTASATVINPVQAQSGNSALLLSSTLKTLTPGLNDLFGAVTQVRGQNSTLIPAGKPVTVNFDKSIDPNSLTVLPEVDARLEVKLTDETGQAVPRDGAVFNACLEHSIFIEGRLVGATGVVPDVSGTTAKCEYGGKSYELTWDAARNAFTGSVVVASGTLPFRVEAVNVGYIYAVDAGQIRAKGNCPPREIAFQALQNGKPVSKWTENIMSLDGSKVFELMPYIDGHPMTKEEASNWKCSAESSALPLDVTPNGKGGWYLVPKKRWCAPCMTSTGSFPVRPVSSSDKFSTDKRDIKLTLTPARALTGKDKLILPQGLVVEIANPGIIARCWKLVLGVVSAVFFIWWLIGVIIKNRFASGAYITYQRGGSNPRVSTEPLKGSFVQRFFIPYTPERKMIEGLMFKAGGRSNMINIAKESVSKGMRVAGEMIEDEVVKKDMKLGSRETVQIEGTAPKTYTYSS